MFLIVLYCGLLKDSATFSNVILPYCISLRNRLVSLLIYEILNSIEEVKTVFCIMFLFVLFIIRAMQCKVVKCEV